jgi:hypothetical protein
MSNLQSHYKHISLALEKDSSQHSLAPVTACISNGTIELMWESIPSREVKQFDIWKSKNGIEWIFNKTVYASDDSIHRIYRSYDLEPTIGNHFYKVTQDITNYQRETIGIVYIAYEEKYDLKIYPNPLYNHIYLLYNNQYYNFNKIEIVDIQGNKIESYTSETVKIPVEEFDPGFYFVHFLSEEDNILKKKIWVKH